PARGSPSFFSFSDGFFAQRTAPAIAPALAAMRHGLATMRSQLCPRAHHGCIAGGGGGGAVWAAASPGSARVKATDTRTVRSFAISEQILPMNPTGVTAASQDAEAVRGRVVRAATMGRASRPRYVAPIVQAACHCLCPRYPRKTHGAARRGALGRQVASP